MSPSSALGAWFFRALLHGAVIGLFGLSAKHSDACVAPQGRDFQVGPAAFYGRPGDLTPSGTTVHLHRARGNARGQIIHLATPFIGERELYVDQRCVWGCGQSLAEYPTAVGITTAHAMHSDGAPWVLAAAVVPAGLWFRYPWFIAQGNRVVIRLGQSLAWPNAPQGGYYRGYSVKTTTADPRSILVLATVQYPGMSTTTEALVRLHTDGHGNLLREELIADLTTILPGLTSPICTFWWIDSSSDGRTAAVLCTTGGPSGLWVDGQVVLSHADPGPDPGTHISDIWACSVNDRGQWAAHVDLNNNEHCIYVDGQVVMRGDRDFLPARVTQVTNFKLTNDGRAYYIAWLTAPGSQATLAVCVDNQVVVGHGELQIEGETLYGPTLSHPADPVVDAHGTHLHFQISVSEVGGSGTWRGVVLPLDLSATTCPDSAGGATPPRLAVFGALYPDAERTRVYAEGLPPATTAVVLGSGNRASLPGAGGALGELCLGAPVRRSRPHSTLPDGTLTVPIGQLTPTALLPASGDTWHYQLWYRDTGPGGTAPVTRFSEAVSVTFL